MCKGEWTFKNLKLVLIILHGYKTLNKWSSEQRKCECITQL